MIRIIYNLCQLLVLFFCLPGLAARVATSAKRRRTLIHRLGGGPLLKALKSGKPKRVWVHALSVGEVLSAAPLVKSIASSDRSPPVVFSVSTLSGYETARRELDAVCAAIIYFPYDVIWSVQRVIKRVNPVCLILVETDLWPNVIWALKDIKASIFLVNARLSDRTFSGYRRLGAFMRPLLRQIDAIGTQSAEDARRFDRLGLDRDRVVVTGNLKFDQEIAPDENDTIAAIRQRLDLGPQRQVIVAGSTHPGEEDFLAAALALIKRQLPDLVLVVAPRDPGRAIAVGELFESSGFTTVCLQNWAAKGLRRPLEVLVIDTIGLLRQLYGLADLAYIGGSLVPFGGHNPLEPAAFKKPILFGPHMQSFREISAMLLSRKGAFIVADSKNLSQQGLWLLQNHDVASKTGQNAFSVFSAHRGAVNRTLAMVRKSSWGEGI